QVRILLGLDGDKPTEQFRELVVKAAEENPAFRRLGLPIGALERIAFGLAKENFVRLFEENRTGVHAVFEHLRRRSSEMISGGHNKALAKALLPEARVQALSQMHWSLIDVVEPLVLPDCVAIAFNSIGDASPLVLTDHDNVAVVATPIGSRRLLVGKV